MSDAALTIRQEYEPAARAQAMTPVDMLSMAVERGANIEVMTKLMDLRDRWEAGQARKAFDEAVASAKAQIPTIAKNRAGHNNKRYADFAAIASVVDPIIGQYGLSYRFRTTQTDRINVTCILSHKAGHAEETTLSGPADTSGSKNAIQAIGSTLTYLQRYTLVQALGLAASEDDDGKGADAGGVLTEEQVMQLREMLEATNSDQSRFKAHFRVEHLAEIRADKFETAMGMLRQKARR